MTAPQPPRRRLLAERAEHPLGAGCRPLGGPALNQGQDVGWAAVTDDTALATLLTAHDHGATVYHTCDVYGMGHSQRLLGRMLTRVRREDVRIACTIGAFRGTGLHGTSSLNLYRQVEQSLENLGGTDYLDVLVLHHTDFGPHDRYLDEALETLQALRDTETIRAVGMRAPSLPVTGSSATADRFVHLFQRIRPEVICTTVSPLGPAGHTPVLGDEDVFGFARRHGAATMICEPLAQGLLTGAYPPGRAFSPGDVRSGLTRGVLEAARRCLLPLRELAGPGPHSLTRLALLHCLKEFPESIVVAGASSPQQARANYTGLTDDLSDQDHHAVRAAYAALRTELTRLAGPRTPCPAGPANP
ncbi:aldo/keto reductase [Streptomyces sp. NPDC048290]|uniref:aldo/keto reductase n=1 Tax=Streptomyces sp. NPDC048290 TaxID=3155811 RepID=UPI0034262466